MPEEILIIIVMSLVSGSILALWGMTLNYRKAKFQSKSSGDSSLTTGELDRLIRKAVEEATAPLTEKIEEMAGLLQDPERPEAPLLLGSQEVTEEAEAPARLRRRQR